MLAAIGIFLSPIVGVFVLKKYYNISKLRDLILSYMGLILICNLANVIYFKFAHDTTEGIGTKLNYDISFFITYTCIGIGLSLLVSVIYIIFDKHIKVRLVGEKNEKKKKK